MLQGKQVSHSSAGKGWDPETAKTDEKAHTEFYAPVFPGSE